MTPLSLTLPSELVEAIAERAAELVANRAPEQSPWLTVVEAAAYTGIPKQTLYKLTGAKAIPHVKPGNRLLFNRDELDAWLDSHYEGPVPVRRLRSPQRRQAG